MSVEVQDRASSARLLLDDPVVAEALAAIEREAFEEILKGELSTDYGRNTILVLQAKVLVVRSFKDKLEQAVSKAVVSRRRPPAVA